MVNRGKVSLMRLLSRILFALLGMVVGFNAGYFGGLVACASLPPSPDPNQNDTLAFLPVMLILGAVGSLVGLGLGVGLPAILARRRQGRHTKPERESAAGDGTSVWPPSPRS
jgi:hypothetical protein